MKARAGLSVIAFSTLLLITTVLVTSSLSASDSTPVAIAATTSQVIATTSQATAATSQTTGTASQASGSWYFTVSGDSRDCGNLIMPKIAKSMESMSAKTPAAFYWHLGDLRNLVTADCDIVIPITGKCSTMPPAWGRYPLSYYLNHAWDDFIQHQIEPFGETTFFLGIGNHELYSLHSREDFRHKFQSWLTQAQLFNQQAIDNRKGFRAPDIGMTYYHFVMNGVDFIYLDNADDATMPTQFDTVQMNWLIHVLAADAQDATVKTVIVGMHEALPYSTSSGHAMDATCQGLCSGQRVYDMLYQASTGPNKKNVYVLASHSHNFQQDVYNTPQYQGRVLPGWIIGTAGASQYLKADPKPDGECWKDKICYGYLLVEVRADATINPQFIQVTPESAPKGNPTLSTFCFNKNGSATSEKPVQLDCACGAAK